MKRFSISTFLLAICVTFFAQINLNDSSVQVISYWDINDAYTYRITQERFKVKEADTLSREFYSYYVDVKVVDSTATSYTVDWSYRDYDITSDNELIEKIAGITEDMTVTIKTTEMGAFVEVLNWKDVRNQIRAGAKLIKKEFKHIPNMTEMIAQIEDLYNTKASIEASAVQEIQQFYSYHGGRYDSGETYEGTLKLPNLYGGEPFDAAVTVWLDEIYAEDNSFILRMYQEVDSEQLTDATIGYLTKMAETMKVAAPNRADISDITNITTSGVSMHGSGWPLYSIQTKEVLADGVVQIDECIIELQ